MILDMTQETLVLVVTALLAISELLGTFSFFKNNSIFQVVVDVLKKLGKALGIVNGQPEEVVIEFDTKKKKIRKKK